MMRKNIEMYLAAAEIKKNKITFVFSPYDVENINEKTYFYMMNEKIYQQNVRISSPVLAVYILFLSGEFKYLQN